ncbi:MAG TPA: GTPase HflX [Sulfurihydrogenibium azorense]|uniref:GTPase HflX n=1 Tax=Sulfurihydrogenibium azorense TaxID=309806 RepID=A0A831YBQ9_9AQUI|nr:GTPase HflX [Sulfurihydrogenibium azorense]
MRAIIVGVNINQTPQRFKYQIEELEGLVEAAEGTVLGKVYQKRESPDPAYYIGKGKVSEISQLVEGIQADTVVFNVNLSPVQIANLSQEIKAQILDRTDLILQIFFKRAKTKQAKLQVELAYLQHQLPRIYNQRGKDLSRIGGGMKTKGAGEKIGEIKTRAIKDRIAKIKAQLKEIEKQKKQQRKKREDNPDILNVALVGYTNAGKSSLLNRLTKREAFISDQLFATLDTKTSFVYFPDVGKKVLLTDTVGFVEDMPQEIMDAFMTTLQEIEEADLILHVIDISDENWLIKKQTVEDILKKLKLEDKPTITVMNKIDKVIPSEDYLEEDESENTVTISTLKGWNLNKLFDILKKYAVKKGEQYYGQLRIL